MFISINFFSVFESSVGFNNFFYLFIFKLLNTISSIDTNVIFLFVYFIYLIYIKYRSLIGYLVPLLCILTNDLPFLKTLVISNNVFNTPNLNLLNGLFLIHPLLLILLLIYLTRYIFDFFLNNQFIFFKNLYIINYRVYKNILSTELLIMSLMLVITGGWWAQQELNWGGWWAWDFVELANLNIVLLALTFRHLPKLQKSSLFNLNFLIFFYFISIIPIYLYTRYNLIPSVHSFLSDLSFLQYDYFINILIIVLVASATYIYYIINPFCIKIGVPINQTNFIHTMFGFLLVLFFCLILNFAALKSISVVLVKFFQIGAIMFIFFHILVKLQLGSIQLLISLINPILTLLYSLIFSYIKLWRTLSNLHYLFYLFVFLIVYNWGVSDLLFYNSVGSAANSLDYFWFKFNNFFIVGVDVLSFSHQDIYQSSQKIVESYFLNPSNNLSALSSFDPIYVDSYSVVNSNTLVSVNRTLFISYYFYYLLPLYIVLTLYLLLLLKMFYYSIQYFK